MKNLLLSTVMAAGFASFATAGMAGAIAEEAPVSAAAPVAPAASVDWSGFYAGGLVSFVGGDVSGFINNIQVSNFSLDATTAFGGFAGYNKQINSMVLGAELAYTMGDIPITTLLGSYVTDNVDAKGRLGYSFGSALVYGVVGYSWATTSDAGTLYPASGLNYGVGLDYMVNDHIFVGAEYLMRNLTGFDIGVNRIDATINSATIRAGYKF